MRQEHIPLLVQFLHVSSVNLVLIQPLSALLGLLDVCSALRVPTLPYWVRLLLQTAVFAGRVPTQQLKAPLVLFIALPVKQALTPHYWVQYHRAIVHSAYQEHTPPSLDLPMPQTAQLVVLEPMLLPQGPMHQPSVLDASKEHTALFLV